MRAKQVLYFIALLFIAGTAFSQRYFIRSGETFGVGEQLQVNSKTNKDYAVLEKDGTLSVYDPTVKPARRSYSIRLAPNPLPAVGYLTLRKDGSFALIGPKGEVAWQSDLKGMPEGNYFALFATNGSLLVYAGTDPANYSANVLWSSATGVNANAYSEWRLPLTDIQAAALSPAQIAKYNATLLYQSDADRKKAWDERQALAEAWYKKMRADEAAKNAAIALEAAKAAAAQAALQQGKVGVACPAQLTGDKIVGRGDLTTEDAARTTMRTRNCLNRPVWITIYDALKTRHLDFGCVAPNSIRDWKGGNYLAGIYFVRAEIVEKSANAYGADYCMGAKLDGGDTTVQVNVGMNDLAAATDVDVMIDTTRGNFYLTNPVKIGQGLISGLGGVASYASERLKITSAVTYAWQQLQVGCATMARYMPTPLTPYLVAAEKFGGQAIKDGATCYSQATETYYCQFAPELISMFDSTKGATAFAERTVKESVSADCIKFAPAAITMPQAPLYCGLGKTLIGDAGKVVTCATAAETAGILRKVLLGEDQTYFDLPSERACRSIGRIAFSVAKEMATDGIASQAKAATRAGHGLTASVVANKLLDLVGKADNPAKMEQLTNELEKLPACKT